MKFKKFLNEDIKYKFKVGDKIKVKPGGADGYEPVGNLEGVVVHIHKFDDSDEYEVGVSLKDFKGGHELSYGTSGPVNYRNDNLPYGKNSGWYGLPNDFELIRSKSKYVKQLKFESLNKKLNQVV